MKGERDHFTLFLSFRLGKYRFTAEYKCASETDIHVAS